jgi:hypothetical protein
LSDRSPVFGQGGKLYVLGRTGRLHVLNAASLLEEWSWAVPLPGPFTAQSFSQLNLDVDRAAAAPCANGQPGVLYLSASSADVTRLYAILVDSAGVDRNAPWPKYQHDPANTGNPATPLTPYSCP